MQGTPDLASHVTGDKEHFLAPAALTSQISNADNTQEIDMCPSGHD